jgi:outer membrane protein TolC
MTRQEQVMVIASVMWCAFAASAAAQTTTTMPAPMPLTLDDAIARGLADAPRLLEAEARVAAAGAVRDSRRALAGPTALVTSGYTRTNHVDEFAVPEPGGGTRIIFPDIPDNWRVRADVQFPVWTGGRTNALVDGAGAELAAAEADAAGVAADLSLEIALAYWHLVTTRARLAVLDEGLSRTDAWVADVQARVDAGVSAPHEVLQAQAHRALQRVQRIQTAQAGAIAERDLVRLTGLPPGQRLDLVTPVDRPLAAAATDAAKGYAGAIERRTERAALRARHAAFVSAGHAAIAALHPQVALFAGIEPARPNARFVPRTDRWHTSWDLGVIVTWSLWDNGRARAERAAARAQADALAFRLAEFDARLDVEVTERLLDLESGQAAVDAAGEAVTAAAELHRVMRVRFEEGVATSTDVLDAHVAWLDASLERTALLAGLRVAESRLQRTLGGRDR